MPPRLHERADPVPRDLLPGGQDGRYHFGRGREWHLSTALLQELNEAGYGTWIRQLPLPPPTRRHREPPAIPTITDAFGDIESLTARVVRLEGLVADLTVTLEHLQPGVSALGGAPDVSAAS